MSETPLPLDPNAGAAPAPDPAAPNVTGAPAGGPTAPTAPQVGAGPTAPQPAAPPKESLGQGVIRGMRGKNYVVDGQGNVVEARTTADSGTGTFGSILGGIVMGALQGARTARPGRVPSQELGGGAGAGVGAAIEQSQQQDARNRGKAEQDFANKQSVQKMSREQAESAATINHLAASTASIAQEAQFAKEDHPLSVALKQAGLDEANSNIQKNAQEIMTNSMKISETLGEAGVDPSALVSSWSQAGGHTKDIVQGRTLPIFNGQKGSDAGVGMYDAQALKTTPLPKPVTYKTYTSDAKGNPVEKENTLPAGTSAFDYIQAAMAGNGQLQKINSQQKVQGAADLNKADIQEKKSVSAKNYADAALTKDQIEQNKENRNGGGTLPQGYDVGAVSKMSKQQAMDYIKSKGGDVPADFDALWSVARYGSDLKTYANSLRKGVPARSQSSVSEYINKWLSPDSGPGKWEETKYDAIKGLQKDFAYGKDAQSMSSFATAIDHLKQFHDLALAQRNGQSPDWNKVANELSAHTGSPVAPTAQAVQGVLVGEAARLLKDAAPDVAEMAKIDKSLNPNASPETIESVSKAMGHAFMAKGGEKIQRYYDWTGELPPNKLSASAQSALKSWGLDANELDPTKANTSTTSTPSPAAPSVQYATAPGKPRLMSKDGGKTWQPAQ